MDPPPPEHREAPPLRGMKKKNLTSKQRRDIVSTLLLSVKPDDPELKLARGIITATAQRFNVDRSTIRLVWQRALANYQNPNIRSFISSPLKKGNSGAKLKWDRDEIREAVKTIPLHQKRSLRSLAGRLGIPKSTVFRIKEEKLAKVIMPVSIAVKPLLTEAHKLRRVMHAVSKVNAFENKYHHFYDSVHVDEKWFFISETVLRCYVAGDETPPERLAQNKDHMIKVMFLCAIARPRFDGAGNCTFDGKIGMWPFVEQTVARRTSKNRNRGDPVTKLVTCDRNTYRKFVIEKVIPAIKLKWPDRRNRRVIIQHDGATAHMIPSDDEEFYAHARQGRWDICLETQPAKSPDTNVLDLSFFRALQSLQWSLGSETTIDGLIRQTLRAFREFEPRLIDFGFLTLQCCLDDILKTYGGNDYKIRHMAKATLLRNGTLPQAIDVSADAFDVYDLFKDNDSDGSDSDGDSTDTDSDDSSTGDDDGEGNENPPQQENLQMIQQMEAV